MFTTFLCHGDMECLQQPIPALPEQIEIVQQFRQIQRYEDISNVESVILSMLLRHADEDLQEFLGMLHIYRELHETIKEYVRSVRSI